MALALLADDWARARGGSRPGADRRPRAAAGIRCGGEAGRWPAWLEPGIASRILRGQGAKPADRHPGRGPRGALLAARGRPAASRAILHLLLAPPPRGPGRDGGDASRDRGSGAAGLAGMAAVREVRGPAAAAAACLAVPKARLIATLAAPGQPWLVDPSNRGRALRPRPPAAGSRLRPRGACGSEALAMPRHARRRGSCGWRLGSPDMPGRIALGFVRVDARGLGARWSRRTAAAVLGAAARRPSAGGAYPGRPRDAASRLAAMTLRAHGRTAGGCIVVRGAQTILSVREPGRIRASADARRRAASGCGTAAFGSGMTQRGDRGRGSALGVDGVQLLALPGTLAAALRAPRVPAAALARRCRRPGPAASWSPARRWTPTGCVPRPGFLDHGRAATGTCRWPRPAFAGVNVVSNPQQPIYRRATSARCLAEGAASAVSCE